MLKSAKILKEEKNELIEQWEKNVLAEPSSTQEPKHFLIKAHLPYIISNLADRLEREKNLPEGSPVAPLQWKYDWQGASLVDYDFPQVIREYSTFRQTINDRLSPNSPSELDKVHRFLDEVIMEGVSQFASARQKQFEELNETLKRSNQDLERFASVVAHDVRSPLTTVYSFIGLLESELGENKTPATDKFLKVISSNTKRLLVMVERLLEYSAIGYERQPKSQVNLNEVIEEVLTDLKFLMDETKSRVSVQDLPIIYGDKALLGQLFQNLITNSIKFRKPNSGATVRVGLKEETAQCWTFFFQDDGIGFAPEQKEIIFQPFKKLHTREEYKGSGLGLATCRRVVEIHGGEIWAESEQNNGSTFYFSICK